MGAPGAKICTKPLDCTTKVGPMGPDYALNYKLLRKEGRPQGRDCALSYKLPRKNESLDKSPGRFAKP